MSPRLDAELVRRGLVRSRRHARLAVDQGRVSVDGRPATKASTPVPDAADLQLRPDADDPDYASRGGYKLAGALRDLGPLGLAVEGRRCLDAGASTGGFTDVLLRLGARSIVAVDVGRDQLAAELRADPRVVVCEGTNVRGLEPARIGGVVEMLVADLSFISLTTVLPSLVPLVGAGGDLLLMVKPQFEVGRAKVGRGGVVSDPLLRALAVAGVARRGEELGLVVVAATASTLPGPAGNLEYFTWLRSAGPGERRWTEADGERLVAGELVSLDHPIGTTPRPRGVVGR